MPLGAHKINSLPGGRRMPYSINLNGPNLSTDQKKFGTASLYMDGTSTSKLAVIGPVGFWGPQGGPPKWPKITIEFWYYRVQSPNSTQILFDCIGVTTGWEILNNSNGTLSMRTQDFSTGSSVTKTITTSTMTLNTWIHVAAVRDGNTWGFWRDGVSAGTFTNTDFRESGSGRQIAASTTATPQKYYIDEFRISYTARYTPGNNFTPSTSAFTNDADTVCLFHFDGANNDTTTGDDNG